MTEAIIGISSLALKSTDFEGDDPLGDDSSYLFKYLKTERLSALVILDSSVT